MNMTAHIKRCREDRRQHDTSQLPHYVVVQRYATSSRPISGVSATTALSFSEISHTSRRSSWLSCLQLSSSQWRKVPVRNGSFSSWKYLQTLNTLRQMWLCCTTCVVSRSAVCKKPVVLSHILWRGVFFIKKDPNKKHLMSILDPPSP